MLSQTLKLPCGRQLGYAIEGEGKPVLYFHGTASSRLEVSLLKQFAASNRFQLIGIDRPGYGLSTYAKRVNLRDFAGDVNYLADYLKLEGFAVLSWSGGGPFALTYTALCPQRVTHTVAVGCPALPFNPSVAHNSNPLANVAMKNRLVATTALKMFRRSILQASRDITAYLQSYSGKRMLTGWSTPDAQFFANPQWLQPMYTSMAEGFRQPSSVQTIYEEHSLFMQPWNEPISQIPQGKLTLWQGAQDKTCPTGCAQSIAQLVKGATVEVFEGEGHCVMFAEQAKLAKALHS